MNKQPLLSLSNISKSFPGVRALSGVEFTVDRGEVVSLVGQNGAGKSTLMSIVGGIYLPDEGHVFIDGRQVRISNPALAEELGIGLVHQEPTLVPNMTVAANIHLNREHLKKGFFLDFKTMKRGSTEVLRALGFTIDPDRLVEDLTLVEKEVVEIAKAMLLEPRILILDEVTAPLNADEVDHLFEIVNELKTKGIAIIFISHRLQEVIRFSDRIVVLRDGSNAGELDTRQRVSEKEIISLMLGQKSTDDFVSAAEACPREEELLSVSQFSKSPHFHDIHFSLFCGEVLGFAGLKGSGITEMFKALYGTMKKDSGDIRIGKRRVHIKKPLDSIECGLGMLSNDRQKEGLALRRSVEENITISSLDSLANKLKFFRPLALNKRAQKLSEKLSIKTPTLKQEVLNLSGGNQQKVVLAKWLLRNLSIVIVDEPTRGVDVRAKGEIHRLLLELKKEGKGVLVASPEIPELLQICDRILVVMSGKIIGEINRFSKEFNEASILEMMHAGDLSVARSA